jgi:hypothetical protein
VALEEEIEVEVAVEVQEEDVEASELVQRC